MAKKKKRQELTPELREFASQLEKMGRDLKRPLPRRLKPLALLLGLLFMDVGLSSAIFVNYRAGYYFSGTYLRTAVGLPEFATIMFFAFLTVAGYLLMHKGLEGTWL